MTTLEKLCRTMALIEYERRDTTVKPEVLADLNWPDFEPAVRAVLTALEDPSDEMVDAAYDEIDDWDSIGDGLETRVRRGIVAAIRKAKEG